MFPQAKGNGFGTKTIPDLHPPRRRNLAIFLPRELARCRVPSLSLALSHPYLSSSNSGMMIGSARLINNLYYFDDNRFENKQAEGFIGSVHSILVHDQIMLWHNRMDILVFSI